MTAPLHLGFHASQEQFAPSELLRYAQAAEAAGFRSVMSADHFNPWSARQGQSGFTWAWLGAAMQATACNFGSLAIPGGWRYHPAILAQAIATLAELFPERLEWIAAGSGQALSEQVVGRQWPSKRERNRRLAEGVRIMRALWQGETVTQETGPVRLLHAKLWSLPPRLPKIFAAVLTEETAEWAAGWADGLLTVNQPKEKLDAIIRAFRRGGGEGKPLYLQLHVSWAENDSQALDNAYDQWRTNVFPTPLSEALHTPALYDAAATLVRRDEMAAHFPISADPKHHIAAIAEYAALGFARIYLHNVGRNQQEFITMAGREILPEFHR